MNVIQCFQAARRAGQWVAGGKPARLGEVRRLDEAQPPERVPCSKPRRGGSDSTKPHSLSPLRGSDFLALCSGGFAANNAASPPATRLTALRAARQHSILKCYSRCGSESKSSAFTLIELLVVIAIIGVLIAIGVSVGAYVRDEAAKKETAAIQDIIKSAIQNFYDETGAYPTQSGTSELDHSKGLYTQLTDASAPRAAAAKIKTLPTDGIDVAGAYFTDAFGNVMDYTYDQASGKVGLGGRPVIISAGPDGNFTTYSDNIRSDGRR